MNSDNASTTPIYRVIDLEDDLFYIEGVCVIIRAAPYLNLSIPRYKDKYKRRLPKGKTVSSLVSRIERLLDKQYHFDIISPTLECVFDCGPNYSLDLLRENTRKCRQ